ncbi:MAG: N-6 DNA methylase [Parvibaculum sp.]|uniref:HsdM family class I SAM-dependent methyltransferase n=1 Tax=Parvibaculum sp. TaxID=2024848 RepID=UPI0032ED5B5B
MEILGTESKGCGRTDILNAWADKKRLGAFYTPEIVSDILCQWAIRKPTETVFEPGFGGCGFLRSAISRFAFLGSRAAKGNLFGCDIDLNAFEILVSSVGDKVKRTNFELCNFMTFDGSSGWPGKFDIVLGNPPYLPYQKIDPAVRDIALQKLEEIGLNLDLRSSTWAYFVGQSLRFLKKGGRVAWVLPGSFLQANYATALRSFLFSRFERVHAFHLRERIFYEAGTEEQTVILLAEGYNENLLVSEGSDIPLTLCETVADLSLAITRWNVGLHDERRGCGSSVQDSLGQATKGWFEKLSLSSDCRQLGDVAGVQIGLVTGDNSFFVLSPSIAKQNKLRKSLLTPILAKFVAAPGLSFCQQDHEEDLEQDRRCLLVSMRKSKSRSLNLNAYLNTYPEEKLTSVSTFKKRQSWSRPDDDNYPDAFLPVMHHLGPRLVLNEADVNCTNTVHRVFFKPKVSKTLQKLVAISMLSTFSQLSAEIAGRKYGSGVLKHEPREAERIRLILPQVSDWRAVGRSFREIDALLRSGEADQARSVADKFVLRSALGSAYKEASDDLNRGLRNVRAQRHPLRSRAKS